ncbi:MAG: hypothetical protein JOY83_28230 [Alphaproteobacteria bacterium]|nr:hypothetical protein [Alphaproteobacteria bacterium]
MMLCIDYPAGCVSFHPIIALEHEFLRFPWASTWARLRSLAFRIWTAGAVLAAYAYTWVEKPEVLTWWKRTTSLVIERGCSVLPYPWGDRIEATLGNFGLWVQITLAIVAFRIFVWLAMGSVRWVWTGLHRAREPRVRNR